MEDYVVKLLNEKGFEVNKKAQNIIKTCDNWYSNKETEFHKRTNVNGISFTIPSLNFAKRICADDANLCEILEVNAGEDSTDFETIKNILDDNKLDVMYRKQLEKMAASGTVGGYIRLDNATEMSDGSVTGGRIAINYCDAENIIPLTVVNNEIIECAFSGKNIVKTKETDVLVIFTLDNGRYVVDTFTFVEGNLATQESLQLGDVRPFFIMRTAEVNNIKDVEGYGYPKLYTAIPMLQSLDLAYNIMFGDLDKGEKIVFINELLAMINKDVNGKPYLTKKQQELFVLLGEKLPSQDSIIKEYNPVIRVDDITKTFELCLSLLSMSFGYGTKKYTFENGQIKTASEYIGEKQDQMQELNKQRKEATDYITNIVKAVKWFCNNFQGANFDIDEEVLVEFDDSYVEDKATKLERTRTDALSFDIPQLKIWYLMDAYNIAEEEAAKLVNESDIFRNQFSQFDANQLETEQDDDIGAVEEQKEIVEENTDDTVEE